MIIIYIFQWMKVTEIPLFVVYDNNGDFVFAWNPFFSIINGKLVLVR